MMPPITPDAALDALKAHLNRPAQPMPDALEIAAKAVRLYAESHPRPLQVTQKQAAEMIGIAPKTMSKIINNGDVKLNRCGLIPISEIDRIIAAR